MKLRYLSDIHLEFIDANKIQAFIDQIPLPLDNEICILAGDIGNPYEPNYDLFMNFVSTHFRKAFVITGNHEYYNKTKTVEETNDYLEHYFTKFDNISFLNNTCETYEGYCFVGTTLWSKITNPKYEISDTNKIFGLDCAKYNQLNEACVEFLLRTTAQETITRATAQETLGMVIITHHMPSESLMDPKFKTDFYSRYNQWFYCNMDELIIQEAKKGKIKCWIYGHTHIPSKKRLNGIPFLCNPIGYPEENKVLDLGASIDI